ncbi:MAG: reverse transcriptase/maturase family protein [Candidatus Paceibacterota bacterium]|jgi:retron-type reverse transcriptase
MKNNGVSYNHIISLKNIHEAWREFVSGKKYKKDVAEFLLRLSENTYKLHTDLKNKIYVHGPYEAFAVNDPKPRSIHKASVRDRLLHHALYRQLYPYFDQKFIHDSYSCRDFKGTHRALDRFMQFARKVSKSNKRTCWVLKCDIRKFFASVDHSVLMAILKKHVSDSDIIRLVGGVVESFKSTGPGKGLPLGNLTSQLLVNVYMNEFDQYVKHVLKQEFYIRYADDFVIMHHDRKALLEVLPKIETFLESILKLQLHPDKVSIETVSSGVDFLGWVHFPTHRVLRTKTKKRMFTRIEDSQGKEEVVCSYLGMLKHGNCKKLKCRVMKLTITI